MNCKDAHDECRNHPEFPSVGQNLYSGYDTKPLTAEAVAEKATSKWHDESEKAEARHLKELGGKSGIGHFTQMVNDRACKLGCAMSLWTNGKRNHFYVVCNYSFGNLSKSSAYQVKGTKCQMGKDHVYGNLCSRKEAHVIHAETLKTK